jgi:SecD/SecF fusion protein
LNLGLDLRGGMNVILEVSVVDIVRSMSNFSTDSTFNRAINNALKAQTNSQKDYVTLFAEEFKKADPNAKLATIFSTLELKDKVKFESSNEQVIEVIRKEAEDAVDRSFNILRTRIDKFGVTQPNIQKLDISGRILIELPGVKDKERVRKLLQGTANLEFWETYDNKEIAAKLIEADKKLAVLLGLNKEQDTTAVKTKDSTAVAAETAVKDTATAKAEESSLVDAAKKDTSANKVAANDSINKKTASPLFELLQPMLNRTKDGYFPSDGPAIGIAAVKDTARIMSLLKKSQIKSMFPRDLRMLWTVKAYDAEGKFLQLVAIKAKGREGRAPLAGNVITDASGDFAQNSSKAEVSMTMNPEGAETWRKLTKDNIGKSIAIVLDDYVYSFPTVQRILSVLSALDVS